MDRAFEGFTYVGNAGSRYMVDHGNNAGSIGGSMNHPPHRRPSATANRGQGQSQAKAPHNTHH
jgi:hypothetical protein